MLETTVNERQVVRGGADYVPDAAFFAASPASFGSDSLTVAFGPISVRLTGLSRAQRAAGGERFAPFLADGVAAPSLTVRLAHAGVDHFLAPPRAGEPEIYRFGSRGVGEAVHLWSYEFAGSLLARAGHATLSLTDASGPRFDRGLENFLRVATASLILDRGGILLHAAGVVRQGRAYVFFGPSGAGKTTVTDLSPADVVLSDDLTLLVPGAAGYVAAGIPFGLAHHRVPATRGSFPVASLNRLVQSRDVAREPLEKARALAEVSASLPFVIAETGQTAAALDAVARLVGSVPVYRLRFRRDASFWQVVEEPRWI